MGVSFGGSVVRYDDNFLCRQMAYLLKKTFEEVTGDIVAFDDDAGVREGSPVVLLCDDLSLPQGDWKIEVQGNNIVCRASSYYGYIGISKYIKSEKPQGVLSLEAGYSAGGSYLDHLDELSESSRYAYDKQGEVRAMFYNVLFYRPAPEIRNILNAEVVKQYVPDILGCQEFNRSKRDFAGERDLSRLLADIGYAETVSPWVRNAATVEEGGYGLDRIDTVTVDGETYYSYSNCTPLFYNTATTKCIESEYYWFKHQLDWQNEGRCSCRDCSSKSMTWGVFEALDTGKRYIVVSVHMCTASAGVKKLQAIEAVEIFKGLRDKYNCPIFIGGDYNALWNHPNYEYFTSDEVGYLDIGRNGVAELHSSEARTYHRPYPVYCEELDMVLPDEADDTAIDLAGGVDHILLDNGENVKVKVYGVVVDEVAAAGSDHYPIFVDFNL